MSGPTAAFLQQSNLVANSTNDFLADCDQGPQDALRRPDRPSRYSMQIQANAVGVELEVKTGGRTVVNRSMLDSSGTTLVVPNAQTVPLISWVTAALEIVEIIIREVAGTATTDVMATVSRQPLG